MPTALLWSYDPEAPSFRHRLRSALPALEAAGWRCRVDKLPHRRYVRRVVERRREIAAADLLVIAKVNLALGEGGLVRRWARRIVFDFDDAIWLRKPRRLGEAPHRSRVRERKFGDTCRRADLAVAGNGFLAAEAERQVGSRAARTPPRIEVVPTPVDVARYPASPPAGRRGRTLVWIGLPENLVYLEPVRPALARLAVRYPDLVLRVVSSEFPDWPEVPIERVPWSEAGEVDALATAGVGLMPLTDDEWSRGKCAFKLLQYMAAGLPCVASPVGANREAIADGESGLLAAGDEGWERALAALLDSPELRARMGEAGRERAERLYDRRVIAQRIVALYGSLL